MVENVLRYTKKFVNVIKMPTTYFDSYFLARGYYYFYDAKTNSDKRMYMCLRVAVIK